MIKADRVGTLALTNGNSYPQLENECEECVFTPATYQLEVSVGMLTASL